jgi:hypothetical protein
MKGKYIMNIKSILSSPSKGIKLKGIIQILAAVLIFTGCATTEPPPPATADQSKSYEAGVPGGLTVNTITISARVVDINSTDRKLTLLNVNGEKETIKVGKAAVNFDQIKKGDLVKITLTEETLIHVLKEGESLSDKSIGIVAGAAKGEKPVGVVAELKQITGTVTAINMEVRTVTLEFEDGSSKIFPVRDDIDLSRHSVGDKVMFIITDAIAIEVKKE